LNIEGWNKTYSNNLSKIKYTLEFLTKIQRENTIILYIDGGDVIIDDELKTIMNKFKELKKNVVFSAEKVCYFLGNNNNNNTCLFFEKKYANHKDKYINSGGWIGFIDAAKRLFAYVADVMIHIDTLGSDQSVIAYSMANSIFDKKLQIDLDVNTKIFLNMYWTDFCPHDSLISCSTLN